MKQGDTVKLTLNETVLKTSLLVQLPTVGKPCIVGDYHTKDVLSVDSVEGNKMSFTTIDGTNNLELVTNDINAIFR